MWIEIILAFIFIGICYIISVSFSSGSYKIPPKMQVYGSKREYPTVIVIGATSSRGRSVLEYFNKYHVNLIAMSRREKRWVSMKDKFPTVAWYQADVRLKFEFDNIMQQIHRNYGSVDMIINMSNISGATYNSNISSLRVKDSVFCKIEKAYDPDIMSRDRLDGTIGNENALFTNIIGQLVVKQIAEKYKCSKVVNILGEDKVVNALIKEFEEDKTNTTSFLTLELANLSTVESLIPLSLKNK